MYRNRHQNQKQAIFVMKKKKIIIINLYFHYTWLQTTPHKKSIKQTKKNLITLFWYIFDILAEEIT